MRACKTHRYIPGQCQHKHTSPSPLWNGALCTLGCKTRRQVDAITMISPSPLWNGAFCTLGCQTRMYTPGVM